MSEQTMGNGAEASAATTILIAAMGGEGGGVLASWLITAAKAEGLIVQSTSIPGVAQRTGATTYYLEMLRPEAARDRRPVMSLYPAAGGVDVMVATELLEAGRAAERGFVTPERTTLIASTHRVYAIAERAAMADARFDDSRVRRAVKELSRNPILFDMAAMARANDSVINAVMLGAMAGSGALPVSTAALEGAITSSGRGVKKSLAAFHAGLQRSQADSHKAEEDEGETATLEIQEADTEDLTALYAQRFDPCLHDTLALTLPRLIDYQDRAYGLEYLDHLERICQAETAGGKAADGTLEVLAVSQDVARRLALWMTFEDAIRVAQLKIRPERFTRIRAESGAGADDPMIVIDYLKPGVEEFCAVLPASIGAAVVKLTKRFGVHDRLHFGLRIRSNSIIGYLTFRLLASLKGRRRKTLRHREESAAIQLWLDRICRALALNPNLAFEISSCARLLKGYGDTHARGRGNFDGIMDSLVDPALNGGMATETTAQAVAGARTAALAVDTGAELQSFLQNQAAS